MIKTFYDQKDLKNPKLKELMQFQRLLKRNSEVKLNKITDYSSKIRKTLGGKGIQVPDGPRKPDREIEQYSKLAA